MLLDHHKLKILPAEEVLSRLRYYPRPEGFSVVLCCGVFDVLHPGHLRHLAYARSRASVLICAITADCHVSKGPARPHVPQELRAASLAMLDIVDYVIVWDADRPDALITLLKPDYYAKGFEYMPDQQASDPIGEVAAVEAYGGEVLYTPGDVVYSSTEILAGHAPDLRWELLATLMRSRELTFDALRAVVRGLHEHKVHVVGDAIVDVLTHCALIGANAKTPTISVRRGLSTHFSGGAAVVARHARAAGAAVHLTTVLGRDEMAAFLRADVEASGVSVSAVEDRARPTTVKEAVVVDGYRLLKIDSVDNRPVRGPVLRRLLAEVRASDAGAVVLSDFRHGIFHGLSIPAMSAAIPKRCMRAADSQVASRWGNICDFRDFDLLTPNEREARFALGDQDSGVRSLVSRLCRESGARNVLMKMGGRGVLGASPAGAGDSFALGAYPAQVVDPVGAGDAFLAYAVLSMLARPGCLAAAAVLGSFAAAVECGCDGNVPVTPERVLAKIDEAEAVLR